MSAVRPVRLAGADAPLSGLLAEPADAPRGLVVGLPGGGMRAHYFHGHADPSLSLLTLGASLGWAVLALDRPGYGESVAHWPRGLPLPAQAAQVRGVILTQLASYDPGTPVALVGHSHGMKVATQVAADEPDDGALPLLSLDLTGSAIRYSKEVVTYVDGTNGVPPGRGRELFWGDDLLYPPGTFDRERSPVVAVPQAEKDESPSWPAVFPVLAPRIRVPVRWRAAEHERWWETGPDDLEELRSLFTGSPRVDVGVQPSSGHNISLGWAARAWHLGALAFAEEALSRHSQPLGSRAR